MSKEAIKMDRIARIALMTTQLEEAIKSYQDDYHPSDYDKTRGFYRGITHIRRATSYLSKWKLAGASCERKFKELKASALEMDSMLKLQVLGRYSEREIFHVLEVLAHRGVSMKEFAIQWLEGKRDSREEYIAFACVQGILGRMLNKSDCMDFGGWKLIKEINALPIAGEEK